MRRLFLFLVVVWVAVGCTSAPVAPTVTPTPTPASLKPANLYTPRPALPPTPQATATRSVGKPAAGEPAATPVPRLSGIPVTVSEPLEGTLLDDRFQSPIIGESFMYRVYLPPDYLREPQRRYPVLYMLHGTGGNYKEWTDSFLPEQIDRLIAADEIQPMIVVMPDDGESTYFVNWDNGLRWGDYITQDVVSIIDERYRTLQSPASRAIGGLSMGGLGALNLTFQHPDVFGIVGANSPSIRLEPDSSLWFLSEESFWENNPLWLAQHQPGLDSVKIWLDAGSDDVWLPNIEALHQVLVAQGLHVEWHEFPGPHEAEYWIDHVPDYLRFYSDAFGS